MAMLMMTEIFAKTWGDRTGPVPAQDFWPTVIGALRIRHPETVLIAEAYWDMEWVLQRARVRLLYDKRLYDRILGGDAPDLHGHPAPTPATSSACFAFWRTRRAPRRQPDASRRRAGRGGGGGDPARCHLVDEGQFEGRQVRPPVFLSRRPAEPPDNGLARVPAPAAGRGWSPRAGRYLAAP